MAQKDPCDRTLIHEGMDVEIIQKQDQRSGKRSRGIVSEILTRSRFHPHGIKVRLRDGRVGRVAEIYVPSGETEQSKGSFSRTAGSAKKEP